MATPADTIPQINAPESENPGLPTPEFPGIRLIQRTDLVGPVATNKPHTALEKRSLSLRSKLNTIIEVVNSLDSWFVRQNATIQKNGSVGFTAPLPMNGHPVTGLPTSSIGSSGNDDYAVSRAQLRQFATAVSALPAGAMWMFGGSSIPVGWVPCNGADYDGTDPVYASLFSVIGFTWGNVGGRFKVPNYTRRFPVGAGGPGGYTLADTGGEEAHTLTESEMPSHSHQYTAPVGDIGGYAVAGNVPTNKQSANTTSAGSGYAHENRPPYAAVNIIIKL